MKKNYKLISYSIVFITLFIWFGNVVYAAYDNAQTFVDDLVGSIGGKYYQVNVEGNDGFVMPRLYA